MNKVVFLDRDGTINVEKNYLHKIEDFEFIPDVIEGLKILQNAGYKLIVITNQSGIARGYYTEEDFGILNKWMIEVLKKEGIDIAKVYYCPHLPDAKVLEYRIICACRKPLLGMYEQAIREFDIDISSSIAIGDRIRDCAICDVYGCRGFLIGNNESKEVIDAVRNKKYLNVEYADNLYEATRRIIKFA